MSKRGSAPERCKGELSTGGYRVGSGVSSDKTQSEHNVSRVSRHGAVAGVVGIESGIVSGVFNLESSGVRASDWRPRHDKR